MPSELSCREFVVSNLMGLDIALGVAILIAKDRFRYLLSTNRVPSHLIHFDARV